MIENLDTTTFSTSGDKFQMTITVNFTTGADFIRAYIALHAKDQVQPPAICNSHCTTSSIPIGEVDTIKYAKKGSFEFENASEYDKAKVMWKDIPHSTSFT